MEIILRWQVFVLSFTFNLREKGKIILFFKCLPGAKDSMFIHRVFSLIDKMIFYYMKDQSQTRPDNG